MKATLPILLTTLALSACSKTPPEVGSGSPAESPPKPSATAASQPAVASSAALASVVHPDLLSPSKATAKAPDTYKAKFATSKGDFVVEVHRDWSPNGADRFYNLVKLGFYDDTRFFRAIDGFMVQFGINGDPSVSGKWQELGLPDDPVKQSNKRGFVTFAQRATPNTRSTQVFVNYGDNSRLDGNFAPFGQVVQGMDVVDSFYKGYGESPDQGQIQAQGNAYLDARFPKLDAIKSARIVP